MTTEETFTEDNTVTHACSFDSMANLLGLFPEDTHPTVQNSILTVVFIVALFVVVNYGNNLNAQS